MAVTDPSVHYKDIVNSMMSAMLVVDSDLVVQFANLAYYQLFGGTEAETLGHSIFEVHAEIWDEPSLRSLLESVIPHDVDVRGYKLEQTFPVIGARVLNVSARRVSRAGAPTGQMLVKIEDATNAVMASRAADESVEKTHAMMTEVHHRVKNNIASILSMLRIEGRQLEDEMGREVLQRIALRVESMGSLYELLAIHDNTGIVQLRPYFERVCHSIEQMATSEHMGWSIEVRGDDLPMSIDDAIALGAVVNELVANAAKYAFNGRQDIGSIRVHMLDRGDEIHITVTDNGIGFDKDHVDPKSTGLGMRLVDMYLATLEGEIERESGPMGTSCFIRVPNRTRANDLASSGTMIAPKATRKSAVLRSEPAANKPTTAPRRAAESVKESTKEPATAAE
ncbi:sensor histidine kinase [Acuticoccus sp. I52.16.1]|uniref:sensor histidine kinase n=1 Tax=Acuticoccus sp. I52.16.1 TaxID=2928472 RepID=UPI001FD2C59F|nr:histidine kinase dimerization/phosphoacceptor domain -containing protein [Acuticoccus sp. I52.16.1]UOM34008.1 ATP-binding protein [Acuticoccus sp. I52.16.1]